MATGRPDMKRWPRHKSGPKKGRMMSYEELREAGKKPVYLTTQSDLFEYEPRSAKPRRKRKSKPSATSALMRAEKSATATKRDAEERAERARKPSSKKRAEKSAERAGEYSGIFGALARLWHGED